MQNELAKPWQSAFVLPFDCESPRNDLAELGQKQSNNLTQLRYLHKRKELRRSTSQSSYSLLKHTHRLMVKVFDRLTMENMESLLNPDMMEPIDPDIVQSILSAKPFHRLDGGFNMRDLNKPAYARILILGPCQFFRPLEVHGEYHLLTTQKTFSETENEQC